MIREFQRDDKCKENSAKPRDDEQSGDSNSIINQKKMLEKYATEQGFTNLRHYTDDGWSGTNFDRPDWKRMLGAYLLETQKRA